ncbi:hypothetical protein [Hymenobacter oligotrophus]|uniref:hypothetical protein n=1 Tax=Hymenobacter oligotrophus TaxID=2319843 RepID=UPI0019694A42|nr:hypothetical protein [Hymenobacter oligotrophus]
MAKKPVKKKQQDPAKKPRVHKELEGFEIKVNPLGEITSTYSIEQINEFLNRHVRDKKLVNREGQFGEKALADAAAEDEEDFPLEEGEAAEPEETDEDFMRRTSREAKRSKKTDDDTALPTGGTTAEPEE